MQPKSKRSIRRPAGGDVHCTIGDFGVSLRSDLKQVVDDFAAIYPRKRSDAAAEDQAIQIEVRRSGRSRIGRRLYRIYADGEEVGGACHANGAFPRVEWGINLRVIARRSEYLQFHAASMAFKGNGVIFAGDSGRGKSTLAALLMTRGWQYLCDEIALVDCRTLAQYPFPKALCIKAGSYRLLRSLGVRFARRRDYVKQFKGRVGYVNPLDLGSDAVAKPAPVRCVIFPTFAGGTTPRLRPISRAEAAMNLFRGCFNSHMIGDTLPIIQTLVNRASCFRLEVGEPQATGQLLEAAVDGSPPKGATQTSAQPPTAIRPRSDRKDTRSFTNRREMLHLGAKLIYVPPLVLTVFAQQAHAANYSCYPFDHLCQPPGQGTEDCCPGLQCTQVGLDGRCR